MRYRHIIYIGIAGLLLAACQDKDDIAGGTPSVPAAGNIIRVGGISADELVAQVSTTRAGDETVDETVVDKTDAENVAWLRGPLFSGLDITYGKKGDQTTSRVAVLRLLQDPEDSGTIKYSTDDTDGSKRAEYSFMFRDNVSGAETTDPAIWYDNGAHFFEGVYVPDRIKYEGTDATADATAVHGSSGTAPNLTTDQHGDATTGKLGNYTLLSHYLGMPSNFTLNATVERIKLPFRHRLARVIAYILIDPVMGSDVTLEGYKQDDAGNAVDTEDPSTTLIKFCNVGVLAGVKETTNGIHHVYTPQWAEARKAIPHFVGERGSYNDKTNTSLNPEHFIAYYDTDKQEYIYPTNTKWPTVNALTFGDDNKTSDGKYERTVYGRVPAYDLIVRPTYTTLNSVMYDEEGFNDADTKNHLYVATNQIDFELTLSNGLNYTKRFVFDLDANYQTVVYLHISRERVDYNSSGSDLWVETEASDDYYGVNNQNGHTLSLAGSSWQRAYTNSNQNYNVTDGHQYLHDSEDEYAQYVSDARWIEMLREAHVGGAHHGDYFILDHDISIPAAAFPDNFVFTGHLDGQDHTITITDATYEEVTQRASHIYVDYDNAKAAGGGGNETKYAKFGDDYFPFDATGMTWYERHVSDAGVVSYTLIADILAYDGVYAYAWTADGDNTDPPSSNDDDYTEFHFYKRIDVDEVKNTLAAKEKPYFLFAGLNGNYSTRQETNVYDYWEANVHKEGSTWVPYKTATDGWRAEIMNVNFVIDTANGCQVFKDGGVYVPDATTERPATITGYLHNSWVNSTFSGTPPKWSGTPIPNYTPSLPEYE